MTTRKIKIADIRYGGELVACGELRDGEADPIIVEDMGSYYDLVDGYHRLGSMRETGESEVTVIIPDTTEFRMCSEFGGHADAMTENDWIDYIQDNA